MVVVCLPAILRYASYIPPNAMEQAKFSTGVNGSPIRPHTIGMRIDSMVVIMIVNRRLCSMVSIERDSSTNNVEITALALNTLQYRERGRRELCAHDDLIRLLYQILRF